MTSATIDDTILLAQVRSWCRNGRARAIRKAAAMTQPELARACGVDYSTVSSWETGRRVPRHGTGAMTYARLLALLAAAAAGDPVR